MSIVGIVDVQTDCVKSILHDMCVAVPDLTCNALRKTFLVDCVGMCMCLC